MSTKTGKLPRVRVKDAALQRYLDALAATVETREGERGDGQDAFITWRDLEGSGLIKRLLRGGSRTVYEPNFPEQEGLPNFPVPPELGGFEAAPAINNVLLSWLWPGSFMGNFAHVNLYRAEVDDFGEAVKIGESTSFTYVDAVSPGSTYYYWAAIVNTAGIEGPVQSASGVEATTGVDAAYVLGVLEGEITESQLYEALNSRIDLIDGPGGLLSRSSALEATVETLEAELADLNETPEFDENEDYDEGDVVRWEGSLYRAVQATTAPSPLPSDTNYWTKIGDYAGLGDAVAAHAVMLDDHETRIDSAEGTLTAQANSVSALQAQVNDSETGLDARAKSVDVTQAIADLKSAEVSEFSQIQAEFNQVGDDLSSKASVSYVDTAVSDEASARATAISQLEATVDNNTAAIQTKAEVSALEGVEDDVAPLKAQWTVKTQVNDLVGGIGLYNDGHQIVFAVNANRFYITDDGTVPFVIDNGQTILKEAVIKDASITTAKMQNAFLDNLAAVHGTLDMARITKGEIFDLTINDDIRSAAYAAGSTGWRIARDGTVEFNNGTFRGHFVAESGQILTAVQIGGETAGNVASWAKVAEERTSDWTRPGSTLINGNKIFTGDAYVDTLQIQGQAVTFPVSAFTSGATTLSTSWEGVLSLSVPSEGIPVFVHFSGRVYISACGGGTRQIEFRMRRGGTTVWGPTSLFSLIASSSCSFGVDQGSGAVAFARSISYSGTQTITVEARRVGGSGTAEVSARSLFGIQLKR